jgi:hypothetical protein
MTSIEKFNKIIGEINNDIIMLNQLATGFTAELPPRIN